MRDVAAAEVVVPCQPLAPTLAWLTETLGFRLDEIYPAEDPAVAVVSGHGVRLRLARDATGAPPALRLACRDLNDSRTMVAPNGMQVVLVPENPPIALPPLAPSAVIARARDARWSEGRAGMRYRDLIPGRQGGRMVASHIVVGDGGEVADYVHHHAIRFQMIYCAKGWVQVVYEDQGPPFVMKAGDAVLQPPHIRHRVLESAPGTEVIEIGSPAEHSTRVDHALTLPTATLVPNRVFGGQTFVRHEAARAAVVDGARDLGMLEATRGLLNARVVSTAPSEAARDLTHDGEALFLYALRGSVILDGDTTLAEGDAATLPPREAHALRADAAAETLEVRVVADGVARA